MRGGRPCDVALKAGTGVGSMRGVEPAARGAAATPALERISDLSRRGVVGHDRFGVERTEEASARRVLRGSAHGTVEVDVVP